MKLRCDACGRLICRVFDEPGGLVYELTALSPRGRAWGPAGMAWCLDHGFPTLTRDREIDGVREALAAGKKTMRVRVSPVRRFT